VEKWTKNEMKAPPYPLQDFKALYKCCIIIIIKGNLANGQGGLVSPKLRTGSAHAYTSYGYRPIHYRCLACHSQHEACWPTCTYSGESQHFSPGKVFGELVYFL